MLFRSLDQSKSYCTYLRFKSSTMAWSITAPWSKAPNSSTAQQADNVLLACLQIKDVIHAAPTPPDVEEGKSPTAMKDNDDTSPHTPKSPMNNALTSSAQTLFHRPKVIGRRSQDSPRSEDNSDQEDTVAELPTSISAGLRPWVRESKLAPRPRDSTNPYTLPRKKLPCLPDDGGDQLAPYEDVPLSGRQENFLPAHHGRRPSQDSTHEKARTRDHGTPSPGADGMPILSPDPYGRDFNKYEHAPSPNEESFSRSPTSPPKIPASVPMDQRTPPSLEDHGEHSNPYAQHRYSADSMRKEAHTYDDSVQATHGTYVPPAYTPTTIPYPQPAYAGAPRRFSADIEQQREGCQRETRRQGLWSWKIWKAGWWTVERVLLILIVLMSFLIFVVSLGKK